MSAVDRLRSAEARIARSWDAAETKLGEYGVLIGGEWLKTGDAIEVHSPYDDSLVAIVHRAGPEEIDASIAKATEAFKVTRKLPSWKRAEVLESISNGIASRHEEFARTIALEAGKPIQPHAPKWTVRFLRSKSRPRNPNGFMERLCLWIGCQVRRVGSDMFIALRSVLWSAYRLLISRSI